MSRKIVEYLVLNNYGGTELTAKVNEHIQKGWEVYGSLTSATYGSSNNNVGLYQVVVRYGEETSKPTSAERKIEPEL